MNAPVHTNNLAARLDGDMRRGTAPRDGGCVEPVGFTTVTGTNLGSPSPRELREYKPRLRFNWRCPECKAEWEGGVTTAYHCGVYAVDADEETE